MLAEFERDLCSERTKSTLALEKRRGECVGQVPYGWRREGSLLVARPDEQQNLRLPSTLRRRGMTYRAIADALSRRGVAPAKSPARWHAGEYATGVFRNRPITLALPSRRGGDITFQLCLHSQPTGLRWVYLPSYASVQVGPRRRGQGS